MLNRLSILKFTSNEVSFNFSLMPVVILLSKYPDRYLELSTVIYLLPVRLATHNE
jgi:hypothetical protein